jgi:hypothetical protein
MRSQGVECPDCGGMFTRVQHSNLDIEGHRVRQRVCEDCRHQFSTVELAVPGLSWARTQRSKRGRTIIARPQYVRVQENTKSVTIHVEDPVEVSVCRSGKHEWTPENTELTTRGTRMCRSCRREWARDYYHNSRRKAPQSILEQQRAYWREQKRRQAA